MKESAVWWVRFRQHGKTVRCSTETASHRKALDVLREREGKVAVGIPVAVKADRLTLHEAADLIRRDYQANGRKSTRSLEYALAHVVAGLGPTRRLSRITTADVERFKAERLEAGATAGTVNRSLAALRRMASLARHQYGLVSPFVVTMLEERNVRTGFFEEDAFRAVSRQLRPELAALATVAQLTGWRKGELVSRQWRHVDFQRGGGFASTPRKRKIARVVNSL